MFDRFSGEAHAVNGSRSSEHWKAAPVRSEENLKVASRVLLSSTGPELIDVSGSTTPSGTSTVHSYTAGGSSSRPNLLVDWTSNSWLPTWASGTVCGEVHGVKSAPSNEHV